MTARQAGVGDDAAAGHRGRRWSTTRASRSRDGGGGYLVLDQAVAVDAARHLGRPERYKETYWARFGGQGFYFAGDGAKHDDDGYFWLLGRVDDVMHVSGHRISTTEVESALVVHPAVAEAAVVGAKRRRRRARRSSRSSSCAAATRGRRAELVAELRDHVGKRDRADRQAASRSCSSPELPKTRSRQDHAPPAARRRGGPGVGDTTTLADSAVMDLISAKLPHGGDEE